MGVGKYLPCHRRVNSRVSSKSVAPNVLSVRRDVRPRDLPRFRRVWGSVDDLVQQLVEFSPGAIHPHNLVADYLSVNRVVIARNVQHAFQHDVAVFIQVNTLRYPPSDVPRVDLLKN